MNSWIRRPASLWTARFFLLVALAGAGYLAASSLAGGGVAGCGPNEGCATALSSRWAYWIGLPVSLPAMLVYLALLAGTWLGELNGEARAWLPKGWIAAFGATVIAAAAWFFFLQSFVLGEWCKFCIATHGGAVAAVVILLWRRDWDWPGVKQCVAAGVAGLAVLIAGQLLVKKPLYAVTAMGAGFRGGDARRLTLYEGRFELDPAALPLIGSPGASNYVVSFFDYTCEHCRRLHPLLKEAAAYYGNRVAIIALPTPLDADCNPIIPETEPANAHACEYASLGLAVWRAQPAAFGAFDDWMFESEAPPSLEEAIARAEGLVGKPQFIQALQSDWVRQQLDTDIRLYIANCQAIGDRRLPQLLIGGTAAHGAVDSMEELTGLIDKGLGK